MGQSVACKLTDCGRNVVLCQEEQMPASWEKPITLCSSVRTAPNSDIVRVDLSLIEATMAAAEASQTDMMGRWAQEVEMQREIQRLAEEQIEISRQRAEAAAARWRAEAAEEYQRAEKIKGGEQTAVYHVELPRAPSWEFPESPVASKRQGFVTEAADFSAMEFSAPTEATILMPNASFPVAARASGRRPDDDVIRSSNVMR